jgi:uncharacterized protein YjbI with pentapeptide repeats
MKYFLSLYSFLLLCLVVALGGCSDSITNSTGTSDKFKARTEAEFSMNREAVIPGAVMYVSLEHLGSPADSVNGDTGGIGEDVITYSYTETATHRIRLDAGALFKARLVNASGAVMYLLNNPGDTARVNIPAGNYKLYLTSVLNYGSASGVSQPVFIQQDSAAIKSGAGLGAQGGYDPGQLNQLLTTKKCAGCNLNDVTIVGQDLSGADLTRARMWNSVLIGVNFSHGNFDNLELMNATVTGCNFSGGNFNRTVLNGSKFSLSDFSGAVCESWSAKNLDLLGCNLRGVRMNGGGGDECAWDGSDFTDASFSNLLLTIITMNNAKLTGATFSNVQSNRVIAKNAMMDSVKFIGGTFFRNGIFTGSKIRYAMMDNFTGSQCNFEKCDLTGTRITDCFFPVASFREANLTNTYWKTVSIVGADMCITNRTGAFFMYIRDDGIAACWP